MGNCDNQTRDVIVPTAHSNYVDRNGILTMDRSGFNVNRTVNYTNRHWMGRIPDSRRISELSIPGTHGSMALHGGVAGTIGDIAINQTMNLETQLNSGIRYIDIRCRHYHNNFAIHHGQIYQHAFFGSGVLEPVISFLRRNPSETILMRIQEEYNPRGNTRTFAETFESFWTPNQRYFWTPTGTNPTLGEVRGRIILLQQFPSNRGWFGINWGSLAIQDQFEVPGLNGIYSKWVAVKNHFVNAMNNRNRIHLNHLSGTGGFGAPRPWFLASGYRSRNNNSLLDVASSRPVLSGWLDFPRDHPTIGAVYWGGMNVLATRRIRDRRFTHTGIVAADFPGIGLIEGTIALNFPGIIAGNHQIVTALNNSSVLDLNRGDQVTLWSNNQGNHQRWTFEYIFELQAYRIASVSNPNLVLTVDTPVRAASRVYASPNYGQRGQFWIMERGIWGYKLRSFGDPNLMLIVAGPTAANGANLVVYREHGGGNEMVNRSQEFTFRPI
ncbi:phosphatidylinositol-specific phospholipase C domain-containing protein [Bacillus toyonensis]|uniref:phosphatidylinositol-specific phospholipase C domain-containing protein n=2 Tax=Bacillus cereus group TaxID=86661 RepID=UPI000CD8CB69|nr:phosphatidylinositol-specific phospholipase C domain-containing protein [Bacillus toyonensis]MED3540438.1 phosphatidylinositol-specific phospholipase C domain-containing protein [Bacillus toyonensis]MEE2021450.1 phosphatidylinositol-specific phospholipase C domain-containing protein [Bacillus toyonensis]